LHSRKPCLHVPVPHDRQLRRGRVHQRGSDGQIGESKFALRNLLFSGEVSIEHAGSRGEQRLTTLNLYRIGAAGSANHSL
jgi:hypothetical protein